MNGATILASAAALWLAGAAHAAGAGTQPGLSLRPHAGSFARATSSRPGTERTWRGFFGVSGVTHALADPEMSRKYPELDGVRLDYTFWLTPDWAGKVELGFLGGTGKVDVLDPLAQVETNSMEVTTVPIMFELLHRWRGGDWTKRVCPYYGVGIGTVECDDRISLRVVNASLDTLDVRTSSATTSLAVSVLAGLQFRIRGRLHGVVETRWIQAGRGRFRDLASPKNAEEEQIYREFSAMIHRPEYDVTGWEGSVGLRWGR